MAASFSSTNETDFLKTCCQSLSGQVHSTACRFPGFCPAFLWDDCQGGGKTSLPIFRKAASALSCHRRCSKVNQMCSRPALRTYWVIGGWRCCTLNGPSGTFVYQSCQMDHIKPGNRSKMVHPTRFTKQRVGWTKNGGGYAPVFLANNAGVCSNSLTLGSLGLVTHLMPVWQPAPRDSSPCFLRFVCV